MTRFLFVRHTAHDWMPKGIAGRIPNVRLNPLGEQQAEELGERLSILPIDAIYCSPLERACETAAPLARRLKLEPDIAEEFNEVDMGDWQGKTFAELDAIPEWKQWNTFRSVVRPPNGEYMLDVQRRVLRKIDMLLSTVIPSRGDGEGPRKQRSTDNRPARPHDVCEVLRFTQDDCVQQDRSASTKVTADRHQLVAIFSHGDVIRATLAHFLGIHLDLLLRFEIDAGSSSLVELAKDFVCVRCMNVPADGIDSLSAWIREDTRAY
jgi:broad specificity phosphatase PhoE